MLSVDEFLTQQTPQNALKSVDEFNTSSSTMSVDEFLTSQKEPKFPVTQAFGEINPNVEVMSGGVNNGVDIATPKGTPFTLPPGKWEVQDAYGEDTSPGYIGNASNQGYGNSVEVKNLATGETMRISHLSKTAVKAGQILNGGYIGNTGDTGNVTGAHVDIEYRDAKGQLQDILKSPYASSLPAINP